MKRYILFIVTILFFLKVFPQDNANCTKEINETVWKPFVKYLQSGNNKGFSALHSKRILRVEIDNNRLQDYERYFPLKTRDDTASGRTGTLSFELRFDKRLCDGNRAWESGYYQGKIMEAGKQQSVYYGRFFVVLEKEEGSWKIVVDADTGRGATEENFKNASVLE